MLMVAGVCFMQELLLHVFTRILLTVKPKGAQSLLTSAFAPLIRVSYGRMVIMARPCTVVLCCVGLLCVALFV